MVIYDGRWQGTAINSSRQLWSIAGNLGIVYTVLFGIDFKPEGLHFAPFVPKEMAGVRRLEGFRYRGAIYDITLEGYGDGIRSFTIDGIKSEPFLDASESGRHQVRIVLNGHLKSYAYPGGEVYLEMFSAWRLEEYSGEYDIPTGIKYTSEQTETLNTYSNDIGTYVAENWFAFLDGSKPLTEWDAYVADIYSLGLQNCIDVVQEAYDAYMGA